MTDIKKANVTEQERFVYIDFLECLAIFFVLAYHGIMHYGNFLTDNRPVVYINYYCQTIMSTCVPLFLFVNGYLLFSKPLDIKKHVRKMIRLMVVSSVWMLLLLFIMQPINGEYYTWEETLERFWNLQIGWNNHLWYMGTLICIYVFFPLLKWAFDTNKKIFYYFTAISAVMTLGNTLINEFLTVFNYLFLGRVEIYYGINFFHIFNPFSTNVQYAYVYFCIGGIVYSQKDRIAAIPRRIRNCVAVVGILICCLLLTFLGIGYGVLGKVWLDGIYSGFDTVFTLGNVIFLYLLSLNWKRDNWLVRTISRNTLGIYFVHIVFNQALFPYFVKFLWMRNLLGTAVYGSIILMLCLVFCLIVRKIPILKHLV